MKRVVTMVVLAVALVAGNVGIVAAAPNSCPGSTDPTKDPGTKWTCPQGNPDGSSGVDGGVKPKKDAPNGW